jgi:hypothetical protein
MDLHQIVEIGSRRNGEQHRSTIERTQRRRRAVGSGFRRAAKRGVTGHVGSVGIDLPDRLRLGVGIRIVDGEVRAILPRRGSRIVVDGELANELKAFAIPTAERYSAFQDERGKFLRSLLRRADEDLARVQIEPPRLGPDRNSHRNLVRRTRAALDEIAIELGGSTSR